MSVRAIQEVAGNAIISRKFCGELLDPRTREKLLEPFDLSPEEREFIASIRADTLHEFATILDDWLTRQGPPLPPPAEWGSARCGLFPDEGEIV